MAGSVGSTVGFFAHITRDLLGTLRTRWRKFQRRLTGEGRGITVGVDVFPFFEKMTGVGWYEWNLLSALDRRDDGLDFNLYGHTFLAPDDPEAPKPPGERTMRMRTHQIPAGFLLPVRPVLLFLRVAIEPLLRVLDDNDLMFAPNFFLARSQLPYAKNMVATVHDVAFAAMPHTVAPETLDELHRFLPDTLFHGNRLIAVSDATANDLGEFLGIQRSRVHVIHEAVDPEFCTVVDDSEDPLEVPQPYLLFVSTLEPRKNVIGVLRCFRLLVEWGYEGSLVLVGRWGWNTDEIREEMRTSPVADRIVHLDYVRHGALPGLYRNADAFLFPSWLEGFGLPLLESMSCGAPVVTSGQSAMPEVAGPAAVYVDPERAFGIATAVAALLEDPEHRQRLVDAGRKRAALFSWDRAAAATAQVLRQVGGLPISGEDEYRV